MSKGTFMVTATVTYAIDNVDPTDIVSIVDYIHNRGCDDMDGIIHADTRDIFWDETNTDGTLMPLGGRHGEARSSD